MPVLLPLHILAGSLALLAGYLALFSAKGATLHRRSGRIFVATMLTMSLTGAWIAYVRDVPVSLIAGLLTFYFVSTAMLTVYRGGTPPWLLPMGMLFSLAISLMALQTGRAKLTTNKAEAIPMFIFGTLGMLAALGDARLLHTGVLNSPARISRHLWRMCVALWVATTSFFYGPPNRVPELIRYPDFYPIPVLTPIILMLFWLWRVRSKQIPASFSAN